MSASKKKKKYSKKLRIEETNNVLSKKELKEKIENSQEEKVEDFDDSSFENTMEIPVV